MNSNQPFEKMVTSDVALNQYFSSLPDYVREAVLQRKESIRSGEDLKRYAENLMENL